MHNSDAVLQRLIAQQVPAAQAAGVVSPLTGLTGLTSLIQAGDRQLLARRQPPDSGQVPGLCRQREYRLLRKLAAAGRVSAPLGWSDPWLLLDWVPGETLNPAEWQAQYPAVLAELVRLHQLPPQGFRLNLQALLWQYWLLSDPTARHPRWLRLLKKLSRAGEPRPLRLAPLHLDVHRENCVQTAQGLRFIDWEYSADGDVALELCMLQYAGSIAAADWTAWCQAYARAMSLHERQLSAQIARWLPWVKLLTASWYSLRSQQSQDEMLSKLAAEAWRQI